MKERALCVGTIILVASGLITQGSCHTATGKSQTPPVRAETAGQKTKGNRDYMSSELRAKVEELKADVVSQASTPETARERMTILYDWANAYALAGGVIPTGLAWDAALVLSWKGGDRMLGPIANLDNLVRELQVREEIPNAIGSLTNDAAEPFPSGSWQTLRQTYTVGEMGMVKGGGILLACPLFSDQGLFQHADPAGDNYVSISCSRPGVWFETARKRLPTSSIEHNSQTGAQTPPLVFELVEGALTKGDTIAITYGDRSGGSRGFKVQSYTNDFFPLPVYVDLEGKGNFFTLPIRPYAVKGLNAHAVKGFAPSVVGVGEPFTVSVRTEDLHYNRAEGPIPAYDVLLNGKPFSSIAAGNNPITLLSDLTLKAPGVYRFQFRSPDGRITGDSNPIWVKKSPDNRIYWGELHAHSGMSEGLGSPEWFFRFGREDARLDFICLSEHDLWMDDSEWEVLRESVKKYNEEGEFIAFLGYEWTQMPNRGGHHNVFFRTPENRRRVNLHRAPSLSELYFNLRKENSLEDVLIIPHAHAAGDWRMGDPDMQRLVEIMSEWGTFQWFGERYVERGQQVGFIAASDNHLGHPGYTSITSPIHIERGGLAAVMAPKKTSDDIFSALRNRSTYATTGERIILDVRLNGAPMGSRAKATAEEGQTVISLVEVLEEMDTDKDGKLQIKGLQPQLQSYVRYFDTNKDNVLDRAEARRGDRVTGVASREKNRRITARVIGTSPIDTVTLFKNGVAIWEKDYVTDEKEKSRFVQVAFDSSSDGGRGMRYLHYWIGDLTVKGADLVDFTVPGLENRRLEYAKRKPDDPNQLSFAAGSCGRAKGILLELDNITRNAAIIIDLKAIPTLPAATKIVMLPTPAAQVALRLADAEDGRLVHGMKVGRYRDTVTLRFVNPDVPMDREFEFTDAEKMRNDDYYYVRVKQLDNEMAWSSPIWVGGEAPT